MPKRTKHPGVSLSQRNRRGRTTWYARWTDPLSGRERSKSLTSLGLTTKRARKEWCIEKSEELREQKEAVERGEWTEAASMTIEEAVDDYLERAGERLAASTVETYSYYLAHLLEWAEGQTGITVLSDLARPHLESLRDHVLRARSRKTGEPLSPRTQNDILSAAGTFLQEARRLGRVPNLNGDDIRDAIRRVKDRVPAPDYLRRGQIRNLLRAAIRHDRDTYDLTREEKEGDRPPGTTLRHEDPASPLILVTLLTGMRRSEVCELRWDEVRLTDGPPEIVIPPERVKTRRGRIIGLEITPSLVDLFTTLRLRAGGEEMVFPGGVDWGIRTMRRLTSRYGAPEDAGFQRLRRTSCTFLTNSQLFGRSTVWRAAARAGHSVQIAERRYAGVLRRVPEGETLEAVMDVEDLAARILDLVDRRRGDRLVAAEG